MSFWAYIITVPALLMFTLFVPKIPKTMLARSIQTAGVSRKTHLANQIYGLLCLTFVVITLYMIMGIKVPTLMVNKGYGTPTQASFVILALSLGAMLGGLLFGKIFQIIGNRILVLAFSLETIAMAVIAVSNTTGLTIVGGFLTGLGVRLFFPWLLNTINAENNGNTVATSLVLIVYNLAGSLSPYTALLLQKVFHFQHLTTLFWISAGIYLVLAIVMLFIYPRNQKVN